MSTRLPHTARRPLRLSGAVVIGALALAACTATTPGPGNQSSPPAGSSSASVDSSADATRGGEATREPFGTVPFGSDPPSAEPSAEPSADPTPEDTAAITGRPVIDTAEDAIARVGEVEPDFVGYEPLGPEVIGGSTNVIVEPDDEGFLLTFVTGSGDCMAGCINTTYDKFRVTYDGSVEKLCQWSVGEEPQGSPC
ncbi:MAG: hypothetical protein H0V12_12195 [Chloroflexi bacterium]|nr:hypothetical protein [Chloroflexota bacterium]